MDFDIIIIIYFFVAPQQQAGHTFAGLQGALSLFSSSFMSKRFKKAFIHHDGLCFLLAAIHTATLRTMELGSSLHRKSEDNGVGVESAPQE